MSSAQTSWRSRRSAFAGRTVTAWAVAAFAAAFAVAGSAVAHGFGQRFDLPVPLELYLAGAGAAVLLSFVVAGLFLRSGSPAVRYPTYDLLSSPVGRAVFSRPVAKVIEVLSVAVFLLVLIAGLIGTNNQSQNIAPLMVWVIWWVGVTYVSALLGNIWPLINPWRILFGWFEQLARRFDEDAELSLGLDYPRWLDVWPGVVLFLLFAWVENAYHDPARPSNIATMILIYSVITWGGMILYGRDRWLARCEAFSLIFGLYARFAPTEMRVTERGECDRCPECRADADDCVNCFSCYRDAPNDKREFNLRPFAVGLMRTRDVTISMTALVVLVLATVTFDGFTDTPTWASLVTGYYGAFGHVNGVNLLGLLAFPLVFLALYLLCIGAMPLVARQRLSIGRGARAFVLSLVPIALAYHLSHYLTYLLVQGQQLIPLASDPFGFGWNLFGTGDYAIDINVVGAQFAWYVAVSAIVIGHIIAVWLAHVVALRLFSGHMPALRSQVPMLALMVGYTVISLWILAQPIVEVNPPA